MQIYFLPPNTTSLIQPKGHEDVLTLKAYFCLWTLGQAVDTTTGDRVTLTEFGRNVS